MVSCPALQEIMEDLSVAPESSLGGVPKEQSSDCGPTPGKSQVSCRALEEIMGDQSIAHERSLIPKEQLLIEFIMLETKVPVVVERFCSIEYAASLAMSKLMVHLSDIYFMGNGRIQPEGSLLSKSCTLDLQHRLRGGCSDTELVPLRKLVAKLIDEDNWLELITIDPDSQLLPAHKGVSEVVGLAEGARTVLRMLNDSLEWKHECGESFDGTFEVDDIWYNPVSNSLSINSKSGSHITQSGYIADEVVHMSVLQKFFLYEQSDGTPGYPMFIEDLISKITALKANGNEYGSKLKRSLIFNHPSMWSVSHRIKVFDSLMLHYHKLPGYMKSAFKAALGTPKPMAPLRWATAIVCGGGPAEMKAVYGHSFFDPAVKKQIVKKYSDDHFGRLDFCRCYLTHFKMVINFSETDSHDVYFSGW